VFSVVGRNGMGKTTLCNTIMGLVRASGGSVRIRGENITGSSPARIARLGVGYVPQGRRLWRSLSVTEHLRLAAGIRAGPLTVERIYDTFPRLAERKNHMGGQLSGGEQQMLAIGRALVLNPRILLLDEPSQGLAPLIVQEVLQVVARLRAQGLSILLVEQNVRAAIQIADVAYVLDDGRIVYAGPAAALAADEERLRTLAGAAVETWSPTPISAVAESRRFSG
jgi:branched-chain amino acid transport system ATP-binding protein